MYDITETIVAHATDPKVAFIAATVFGYCLYKFMIMTNRRSHQFSKDSDEMDNNVVKISINLVFNCLKKFVQLLTINSQYLQLYFLYIGIHGQI